MTIWSEGSLSGPRNRKLLQAASLHDLPHEETTLASHLQQAGYLTALVGKWHLGDADHYPETHGFEINIGGTRWGAPHTFWWPYQGRGRFGNELRYVPGLPMGAPGEYLTDRLTDEAIQIMDQAAEARRPFFLYLAHHAPHTPIEAPLDLVEHFEKKLRPGMNHQHPVYAAMVKRLDDNVGRLLDHLEKTGLARNTVVVFASDNGGYVGPDKGEKLPVTHNGPLRSGKGSVYEGGIRIPLIIRWPGITEPGGICSHPVVLMDLFETLLPLAGKNLPQDRITDGRDLNPLLRQPNASWPARTLHFHYPHYYSTTTPVGAIRDGDWKLLEYFEDGKLELYHLGRDPGETRDLAQQEPKQVQRLLASLKAWRDGVKASMPEPNPDFRPRR